MKYNENQVFELMRRLVRIYLESFPEKRDDVEHFCRWAHKQFGYEHVEHQ